WQVHLASSGPQARRLVRRFSPEVLVLDTSLRDESGWLTCAKLRTCEGAPRIILVAPDSSYEDRALADFVGASALLPRGAGPSALLKEVLAGCMAAAV